MINPERENGNRAAVDHAIREPSKVIEYRLVPVEIGCARAGQITNVLRCRSPSPIQNIPLTSTNRLVIGNRSITHRPWIESK